MYFTNLEICDTLYLECKTGWDLVDMLRLNVNRTYPVISALVCATWVLTTKMWFVLSVELTTLVRNNRTLNMKNKQTNKLVVLIKYVLYNNKTLSRGGHWNSQTNNRIWYLFKNNLTSRPKITALWCNFLALISLYLKLSLSITLVIFMRGHVMHNVYPF